jgi:hypothetical protein
VTIPISLLSSIEKFGRITVGEYIRIKSKYLNGKSRPFPPSKFFEYIDAYDNKFKVVRLTPFLDKKDAYVQVYEISLVLYYSQIEPLQMTGMIRIINA